MRVLFIGGTGLISSAVTPLLLDRGHELTLVTRGQSPKLPVPPGASWIEADARDKVALRAAIAADVAAKGPYDSVVQWIGFDPDHISDDIETFAGITSQYVFISSASAYQKPPRHYVVTEATPLENPYWQYSRDKAESEARLAAAHTASGFPFTAVRPSHTYGFADFPLAVTSWVHPWTAVDRMLRGAPVLIHGDGSSLWALTDHRDFAVGIAGLLGNPAAVGETFHITSDDVLPWNTIYEIVADAVGVSSSRLAQLLVHIPTDLLMRFDDESFTGPLMGDKTHSLVFDNSKLKALVPEFGTRHRFADTAAESAAWFLAMEERRTLDHAANTLWDDIAARYARGVKAMFD